MESSEDQRGGDEGCPTCLKVLEVTCTSRGKIRAVLRYSRHWWQICECPAVGGGEFQEFLFALNEEGRRFEEPRS